jgi:hypothetical protein
MRGVGEDTWGIQAPSTPDQDPPASSVDKIVRHRLVVAERTLGTQRRQLCLTMAPQQMLRAGLRGNRLLVVLGYRNLVEFCSGMI